MTAILLKLQVFWNMTPVTLVTSYISRGACYLHVQRNARGVDCPEEGGGNFSQSSVNAHESIRRNIFEYLNKS